MTKDQIKDSDPIIIEDDCIDEWCSTSSAAVLTVLSLAFGNRTPSAIERPSQLSRRGIGRRDTLTGSKLTLNFLAA